MHVGVGKRKGETVYITMERCESKGGVVCVLESKAAEQSLYDSVYTVRIDYTVKLPRG